MQKFVRILGLVVLLLCVLGTRDVLAQGTSTNYRIDESYIGPGGALESNSTSFQTAPGSQSIGSPAAGGTSGNESNSTNYRTQSGPSTTDDPSLSCVVNTSSLNFGALSTNTAATATATFSVLNYTSYGYIVQMVGSPPSNGGHTLAAMSTTGPSVTGTEQFGINLVANTSPTTFGADPDQVPDSSFSFGEAGANYDTANEFRYVVGETVATAPKSSGQTDYTVSYVVNASNTTPGGVYNGSQTLVCIGTY